MSSPRLPTGTEALQQFREGALNPIELLEQVLSNIDDEDQELNAYVSVDRIGARRCALSAEQDWQAGLPAPLSGLPISVKDIIDIEGQVTGCGNAALKRGPAARDATVIRRLKEAGAMIVGKVHLHELALGITGENKLMGTPKNPHDRTRLPGGSSSGSAVSVAADMAVASIGTDTGGSIRVPAALCGLVGFKPSFGRISRRGVRPLSYTMDHVGVIGRTVADVRILFTMLQGIDPDEPETHDLPPVSYQITPRKVALVAEYMEAAAPGVTAAVEATLDGLHHRGIVVGRVSLPEHRLLTQCYTTILLGEAAAVHAETLRDQPDVLGDGTRQMLQHGSAILATEYVQAMRHRSGFAERVTQLFGEYDCLLAPTTLVPAPEIGESVVEIRGQNITTREALISCTCPFSMVGLPAVSVPCGTVGKLPVGLQVIGPRFQDGVPLQLAQMVENLGC